MNVSTDELPVPCSYTRIVARELGLQERELDTLLRGTGLTRGLLLSAADAYISTAQQMRVLENAQFVSTAPDIGLQLGRRLQPSSHGPMGYLVLSSPDVMTALTSFAEFLPVRLPFSSVHVTVDDNWLNCSLELKIDAKPEVHRLLNECFAMMIQAVVESVTGSEMHDAVIELAYPIPDYHHLYANYLHSPVDFSQENSVFRIPARMANIPNASGNSEAYAVAQSLCQKLLETIPATERSTAYKIRKLLLSAPMGSLTATDVARAMFVTKRTLQRRLDREGTSYREITEELRCELAIAHLREPDQTIEAVAALLGYCDTAAFRKAFRRWRGQSPGEFRRNT
ncbi:HTH-type transcriptional regulator VirS [Halioglobus japonicus]|nr:HTH-type transcriptional regulator VirS [Halioglobus japonicus]